MGKDRVSSSYVMGVLAARRSHVGLGPERQQCQSRSFLGTGDQGAGPRVWWLYLELNWSEIRGTVGNGIQGGEQKAARKAGGLEARSSG